MDSFVLIVVGGLIAFGLALYLIGRYYPGSGADVIDWKPTRSVEKEIELELHDIEQMLAAQNRRRRARGERERTEEEVQAEVAADQRDARVRSERYLAGRDLEQLLEATNAHRRARGQRELSADELRAGPPPGA